MLHFALMASVVLILTAGDALTFLLSWECMSILCYLLVNYEQRQETDSSAGYIMLAMSEAGFLAVVIAFLIAGEWRVRILVLSPSRAQPAICRSRPFGVCSCLDFWALASRPAWFQ